MTPADLREAAARLVERTCEAQGLPATVTDPAALARMAAFMQPDSGGVGPFAPAGHRVSPVRPHPRDRETRRLGGAEAGSS